MMDVLPFFEPQADDEPEGEYAACEGPKIMIEKSEEYGERCHNTQRQKIYASCGNFRMIPIGVCEVAQRILCQTHSDRDNEDKVGYEAENADFNEDKKRYVMCWLIPPAGLCIVNDFIDSVGGIAEADSKDPTILT